MIANTKTLKKITLATGVVAMSVGLVNAFSLQTQAAVSTTGGKIALVRNCVANGVVYAYATTCAAGSSSCTATACPAPPVVAQ